MSRPKGYQRLAELIIGAKITASLRVVVDKGIADLLANGPKSIETLARETGFPVDNLRRFMRAMVQIGLFVESENDEFSNTEVSDYLRRDVKFSLPDMIVTMCDDAVTGGWDLLPEVLMSGEPAFVKANGITFFDYLKADSGRSSAMASFMSGIYGPEGVKIAAGYPFGRFKSLMDVGAGRGNIIAEILAKHTELRGATFDLAPTAAVARKFLSEQGLLNRCQVFEGDFFLSVPEGFDAYMIKSVLHDWDDSACVKILSRIREAMPSHARVLVVEIVLTHGRPIGHPHLLIDLEMMVTVGGKERSKREFDALLNGAGLKLDAVIPIEDSFFSVVEASKI